MNSPTLPTNFSTSTPARTRSPRPSISFADPSPGPPPALQTDAALRNHHATRFQSRPEEIRTLESNLEARDQDILATARASLESREFLRAVHLLRDCRSSKARFLSIYSQFMVRRSSSLIFHWVIRSTKASEKNALRDWHKLDSWNYPFIPIIHLNSITGNRHQPPAPLNSSLNELLGMVRDTTDPWLLFLY